MTASGLNDKRRELSKKEDENSENNNESSIDK